LVNVLHDYHLALPEGNECNISDVHVFLQMMMYMPIIYLLPEGEMVLCMTIIMF